MNGEGLADVSHAIAVGNARAHTRSNHPNASGVNVTDIRMAGPAFAKIRAGKPARPGSRPGVPARGDPGRRDQPVPRSSAPVRRAASATAASRAAVVSSTVSVRSGARNRSV
jgi:hypothetical protein